MKTTTYSLKANVHKWNDGTYEMEVVFTDLKTAKKAHQAMLGNIDKFLEYVGLTNENAFVCSFPENVIKTTTQITFFETKFKYKKSL